MVVFLGSGEGHILLGLPLGEAKECWKKLGVLLTDTSCSGRGGVAARQIQETFH